MQQFELRFTEDSGEHQRNQINPNILLRGRAGSNDRIGLPQRRNGETHISQFYQKITMLENNELSSAIAGQLNIQTEMGREMINVALECIKLFDQKQLDYGSNNIAISGELGVAVRLTDKVCRMQNLLRKNLKGECDPKNESLTDTYLDTANYGMIGYLLNTNRWK